MGVFFRGALRRVLLSVVLLLTIQQVSHALPRTWIGGNVDWIDAGSTANWTPADEPDSDDEAIFNSANSVNLGSNNAINGLTMSGGIDLSTNDFDLTVDGLVQLTGASTNLFIGGAAGSIDADDVAINSGGIIELRGGTLTMDEEAGTALIDLNAGGTLAGNGTILFLDTPGVATLMLVNDGTLTALSRGLLIFSPPPVGTLTITDSNANGRIDLDGTGEAGVVNVNRNQTLATDMPLQDTFNGTLNLFHNSTFQFNPTFTLGTGGSIIVDNGFVAGGIGVSDIPADVAFFDSAGLTQTGGTINVVDTDGTLQLDAPFTMSGGSFTNMGTVIFNGVANITTAAGYAPNSLNAQTIVNADVTINDATGNFNWDGNGAADTTVNGSATLSITANQIDTTDNVFGGTITLNNGGDLFVNNVANSWTIGGSLIKTSGSVSTISGDALTVTGVIEAGGTGTLNLPTTTLASTANVNVTSRLTLGGASVLAGPAALSGTGELQMVGTSTVTANTTVNVATFDWDGIGTGTTHTINSGVVFTINSPTFDNDGDMDDPITLAGSGSTLLMNGVSQWTMNGLFNANTAGVGTATIGGTSRLIVANTINVDGNTTISAPVTFNGAGLVADIDTGRTLDVSSSATTYIDGTIDGAGTFDPGTTNIVTGDFAINSDGFDFDGGTWTVESGARLVFNTTDYEPDSVTNSFESILTLNNGRVLANSPDPAIVMNGTLNMNASLGNGAEWSGDAIDIGNDAASSDANLNVTGDGNANSQARFFSPVVFRSDADVNVAAGGSLVFNSSVTFATVNGANNAEFTGSGTIGFNNQVLVSEAVILNMVGGTVDLDGNDTTGDVLTLNAPLTLNVKTMSDFGRVNISGGVNTLNVDSLAFGGTLTVNLDDPAAEWTLALFGVLNIANDNVPATVLAGNDFNINGTVNVIGDVRTTARVDIHGGIVNINTAGEPLRLAGGTTSDPNMIIGGMISGIGLLGADDGKALHGFGTINTGIDFDGTSSLLADNGTLTVNGAIIDVGTIGTFDVDGTLHVTNAWNNNVSTGVQLNGGTLSGGTITNEVVAGISGHGLVTARVINNTQLFASITDSLIFQTAANDSDWDGTTNTGSIKAVLSNIELRDNATFGFLGTVEATNGHTAFTNGFALDFNPGSTLSLASGGKYESTNSTDFGGTVTVGAGTASTIKVANNTFLTFESTSDSMLNGNLRLENNNINIESLATFTGGGALIIPDDSHLIADNLANIGVLLDMQGTFRPGGFDTVGRIDLLDYQQANTGELFVELTGTALNAFDRLVLSGDAVLDGYLNIDIDGAFVPTLGQTFNIITANTVTGAFDFADISGMPAGLTFHLNYLSNAVQLQVVNTPFFSADFDDDGDVDPTDLAIWQGAYGLNQLGDADGDNDSDGRDYLLWQRQFGSAPLVAAVNPVPEPGTAMLLAIVVCCSFLYRDTHQ